MTDANCNSAEAKTPDAGTPEKKSGPAPQGCRAEPECQIDQSPQRNRHADGAPADPAARPGFPVFYAACVVAYHETAAAAAEGIAQILCGDESTAAMLVARISEAAPASFVTARLVGGAELRAMPDPSARYSVGIGRLPEGGLAVLVGDLGEASPDELAVDERVAQLSAEGGRWVTVRLARENCHNVSGLPSHLAY